MILRLATRSLMARALTVGLTVLAIALSVALFLGIEKVRTGARASFADTISGTDLIVGARSGSVQLLLYSVFRIGNATNNVTWDSYQDIAARPEVDWIVPISLGDSHRQFRVMGTTPAFFDRYKYRGDRDLVIGEGAGLNDLYDAVIGADVAQALGYAVGDAIVVSHGVASFTDHDDQPFRVAGIVEKTGTPVDRTVIVSLEAIEAIHVDWQQGGVALGGPAGPATPVETIRAMDLTPSAITAALVGVDQRTQIFGLQRWVNDYSQEPLLAVLPGVALQELWQIVGVAETALVAVSGMVVVTALLGMMAMILSSLNERRREMAIWRAMGARPATILSLLVLEAVVMAALGAILGFMLLYAGLWIAQPLFDAAFGLWLPIAAPHAQEFAVLGAVVLAAAVASLVPALRAYRLSLADGMMVKI
ncbi:putative ABC transport system permease protein [Loktanella fryxellensis]|uniref:Putative ABC transport system permease protein n=1 Tax=Loktanella fryxellensis TaxID=245187 RepID=A0A1H8A8F4_9RHOB|nr:ABC transporter permease [Loktanella fryxellensis]SEM66194.1 putative ABC transport system permease protein [Loktanella fryxellensis]